ncbi:MAG: amidohydrolase family protein [Gemmatimonadetes bacterium]|nr:amidohydrolase family protein [Gemmatimonadota bacterium]MBT6144740.1 amidohydrolase family protein [Gemmatimonadota bacterium]MBT7861691.1 amidohydrolase family protein [Gemmatimonadota bacterium]
MHPLQNFGSRRPASIADDIRLLRGAAERAGITQAVLFSLHDTVPRNPTIAQCVEANDYAQAMAEQSDGFFLPFCYVTPDEPTASADEIDRCIGDLRMAGVKLWVARKATDAGLDPIMERVVNWDVPVLQHAWRKTTGNLEGESTPADVADLAGRHPQAKIIMAHLNGCNPRGIEDVVGAPNVCVDTAGGDPESGVVELAVARLGADRVVFGSDAPIRHFGVCLAKILGADLSPQVKRQILWDNLQQRLPIWARAGATT